MSEAVLSTSNLKSADKHENTLVAYLQKTLHEFHPAYFGLIMATGIVSLDCRLFSLDEIAGFLFAGNIAIYFLLWVLYVCRAALFPSRFVADLFSHKRAFGFFTVVAATNVLGTQYLLFDKNLLFAAVLWWVGLSLWIVLTYSIFVFLIIQKEKPSLEDGINGGWLLAVVATQSICVLGCQIQPQLMWMGDLTPLLLLSFWLFGGMLYIWLISLIFYRYLFFKFEPSDLIPPYWINMGAMAITTLAGAELIRVFGSTHLIGSMLAFMKGLSIMYWATATWWIPMLAVLGVWRHGVKQFKFTYDPLYWGLVFPLGMYSVCTLKLGTVLEISSLARIAQVFLVLGLMAWCLTFLSMAQRPLYVILLLLRCQSHTVEVSTSEEKNYGCK
ncbi:tellurite resistance/C4-dicarboxylate transporter family protein [bacterium]|nr:tellurite resistance/C4-dicarboxylate transporter family protein [bacterium]MBP9807070.1 tellurite resistance/C4-dicarboxylate transporter family protein [bacterium]